jgi:hypothetical protein
MNWLEQAIHQQRDYIEGILVKPLSHIATICAEHWENRPGMDLQLKKYLEQNKEHRCRLLYVINKEGHQYSSGISDYFLNDEIIGRDLTDRPYLEQINAMQARSFLLSDVYVDKQLHKPCITALHSIKRDEELFGYIAADFGLKDLPLKQVQGNQCLQWRQIKGDPSIRRHLFQQTRSFSPMDEHLDEVLDVVESLMIDQGIFHAKLHFSSSRATLWSQHDPFRYQLHVLDEIINPKVCLLYAKTSYPEDAAVTEHMIPRVLKVFKSLREADETIYLRAASLNIMNGLVGLNFSCDGSHYMPADEFLSKDLNFWFGCNVSC